MRSFVFSVDQIYGPNVKQIEARKMGLVGHVACVGEYRNACRDFVLNSEGKGPFERPRREWKNGIKMDLTDVRQVGCRLD
jgi:hypothetical protein